MSRFQLIFTGVLVAFGIGGAILFAVSKNTSNQGAPATVMWGTLKAGAVSALLSDVSADYRSSLNVTYVQKDADSFESDLIAALARGAGPDMVLLPQDLILKQLDKFYVVPFSSYSERSFKSSFIQEGELYLTPEGIVGFPFSLDPLVMYWNRDIFADAGAALPPKTWAEFFTLAPQATKKDANGNITQSLAAFGEARNVAHYKDVLALLALQAGTPIVGANAQGYLSSRLADRGSSLVPGEEALSFYTEFSNPAKASYTWNRSLPQDRNAFAAGRLGLYFGYASELSSIRAANPNLNFDVAPLPQTGQKKVTFGSMTAIALLKASKNLNAAFMAAATLTSAPVQQAWVEASGYAPVRRDMLASLPGDAYKAVFYQSALTSNAWLDPNREGTDDVFWRMIENVTSGKLRVSESVRAASQEIDGLIRSANQ
ncbi:MAG TPA: extracellular solute-binding protein [Candidatus Paceibacterota bacterium]|nr:extracellular solute-binding protein [Candidatus Paceibacterota bacterium]